MALKGSKPLALHGFAGIRNTLPPERVRSVPTKDAPLVDLVEADNVDIDNSGQLRRRAGQTLKVAGAIHSLWAAGDLALYVQDGTMYRLFEDMTAEPLAEGLGSARMSYVLANERVYHANGEVAAVVDEGRVRTWGIALSDVDVAASATSGNLDAGVYLFAMTLLRADGQESGTGAAQRIDLAAGAGIAFSWSVPADTDITDVALYLSQPNGETLLQAAVVDVEAGQYTYTGGVRSLPLATQWLDAPPVGSVLAAYRGRIYIAAGDVLYATAALSYEHCDLRDYRAFDGSEIRIVAPVEAGLFVGTAQAVYFLAGASFADNTLVKKMEFGAVKGSLVQADGGVVTGQDALSGKPVVLFTTTHGVVLGLPDGTLTDLTEDRFAMPATGDGAAVLIDGTATRYIVSMTA